MATRTGPVVSLMQSTFLGTPDVIKPAAQVGPQRGPFRNQLPVPSQLRPPLHLTVHLAASARSASSTAGLGPCRADFTSRAGTAVGCVGCSYATTSTCAGGVCGRKRWLVAADGGGNPVQGWHPHTHSRAAQADEQGGGADELGSEDGTTNGTSGCSNHLGKLSGWMQMNMAKPAAQRTLRTMRGRSCRQCLYACCDQHHVQAIHSSCLYAHAEQRRLARGRAAGSVRWR